jgi:hypothetical protein
MTVRGDETASGGEGMYSRLLECGFAGRDNVAPGGGYGRIKG